MVTLLKVTSFLVFFLGVPSTYIWFNEDLGYVIVPLASHITFSGLLYLFAVKIQTLEENNFLLRQMYKRYRMHFYGDIPDEGESSSDVRFKGFNL